MRDVSIHCVTIGKDFVYDLVIYVMVHVFVDFGGRRWSMWV